MRERATGVRAGFGDLLIGAGASASEAAQRDAQAIGAVTGCRVIAEFYNARMPGGRGRRSSTQSAPRLKPSGVASGIPA